MVGDRAYQQRSWLKRRSWYAIERRATFTRLTTRSGEIWKAGCWNEFAQTGSARIIKELARWRRTSITRKVMSAWPNTKERCTGSWNATSTEKWCSSELAAHWIHYEPPVSADIWPTVALMMKTMAKWVFWPIQRAWVWLIWTQDTVGRLTGWQ